MADITENILFTDPATAISQGKRHLLVRDYSLAVTALAQACELLAEKHGDASDDLGEPYLLYGRALLGLAREETGVLGGAVPGSEEAETEEDAEEEDGDEKLSNVEEEKEDDEEEEGVKRANGAATEAEQKALAEKKPEADSRTTSKSTEPEEKEEGKVEGKKSESEASTSEKKEATPKVDESNKTDDRKVAEEKKETSEGKIETSGEKKETFGEKSDSVELENKVESSEKAEVSAASSSSEDKPTTNGDSKAVANGEASENGEEEEGEEGEEVNKEDDEDDVNNLQLAWEVLELAKLVLLKRGPPGWKHLAEAHRLLGEVAMEGGNHQGALTDLQACLDLLAKIDPCEPRAIAEIHYQLGLAHSLANDFDASIEQFKEATVLLESRIKELEETKDAPKSEDPFYSVEGEIKELKELLPEIQDKIADMKDFKQETCKAMIEGIKNKVAEGCSNGAGPSGSADGAGSSTDPSPSKRVKPASDISHLVRKKRKADETETETASPLKKPTPEKAP